MSVVVFDVNYFKAAYPSFDAVAPALLQVYFDKACLLLNNTEQSMVTDLNERKILLNLLVAHLAALNSGENGQAPSGLVGRVTSASEGSISASTDYGTLESGQAWYIQTRFGAEYWQLTAKYRTMRYVVRPRRLL